jgi:hypothetical protein
MNNNDFLMEIGNESDGRMNEVFFARVRFSFFFGLMCLFFEISSQLERRLHKFCGDAGSLQKTSGESKSFRFELLAVLGLIVLGFR